MKIVILEDESIVVHDLKLRLQQMGYEVVAAFDNGKDLLAYSKDNDFDLYLVDINIKGDINGVATVKQLLKIRNIPVIYLTAQADNDSFEKAKETKPAAYLLKPYNDFDLRSSIELAIENFNTQTNKQEELFVVQDKIFIRHLDRYERVILSDIQYIEASGNYTEIITKNNKYLVVNQLGKFEPVLNEPFFYRCHRSFIVNLHAVDGFDDSHLYIGNKQIPISRNHKKEFLDRLRVI
ncbi:response regulator [bacterium]|nr:response regulator [bacterium]